MAKQGKNPQPTSSKVSTRKAPHKAGTSHLGTNDRRGTPKQDQLLVQILQVALREVRRPNLRFNETAQQLAAELRQELGNRLKAGSAPQRPSARGELDSPVTGKSPNSRRRRENDHRQSPTTKSGDVS